MGAARSDADVGLFATGAATVPRRAWAPLFAHRFGVRPDLVVGVLGGVRDTRAFDVAVASRLVEEVGARWGRNAATAAAGRDTRVSVREACADAPERGSEAEAIRSADELAEVLFSMAEAGRLESAAIVPGLDERVEVVFAAAAFTGGGFALATTRAQQALASLNRMQRHRTAQRSRSDLTAAVVLAAAAAWADSAGVDSVRVRDRLGEVRVPQVAAPAALAVFCAALVELSQWWRLPELPDGLLDAAAGSCAEDGVATDSGAVAVVAALAAQIFEVTGSVDAALVPFGPGASVGHDLVLDSLSRRWFTAARSRYGDASPSFLSDPGPARAPFRPWDAFLSACTGGGETVRSISHECMAGTSPEFSPFEASAFWHSSEGFARDLVAEFAHMCSGRFGHRWDPVGVLDVVRRRGDDFAAMFAKVLPSVTADVSVAGFEMPSELVEFSMRTVGLRPWAAQTATPAYQLVAALEAAAAARELSAAGWATVWSLLPEFVGTPDELVEVAALASPDL